MKHTARLFIVPKSDKERLLVLEKTTENGYMVFEDWKTRERFCYRKSEVIDHFDVFALRRVGE